MDSENPNSVPLGLPSRFDEDCLISALPVCGPATSPCSFPRVFQCHECITNSQADRHRLQESKRGISELALKGPAERQLWAPNLQRSVKNTLEVREVPCRQAAPHHHMFRQRPVLVRVLVGYHPEHLRSPPPNSQFSSQSWILRGIPEAHKGNLQVTDEQSEMQASIPASKVPTTERAPFF